MLIILPTLKLWNAVSEPSGLNLGFLTCTMWIVNQVCLPLHYSAFVTTVHVFATFRRRCLQSLRRRLDIKLIASNIYREKWSAKHNAVEILTGKKNPSGLRSLFYIRLRLRKNKLTFGQLDCINSQMSCLISIKHEQLSGKDTSSTDSRLRHVSGSKLWSLPSSG